MTLLSSEINCLRLNTNVFRNQPDSGVGGDVAAWHAAALNTL